MMGKISVVINTFNEEKNIERVIKSVKWADEILVCDMQSEDKTVSIARVLGAKVISHKNMGFVEPGRNFAISKAMGDWILILDADEELPISLSQRLQELAKKDIEADFVEISRKNVIFNKWIENTGWWPDYQIRFFRKGKVSWNNEIHGKPKTNGAGLTLEPEEQWSIIHHNYQSVSDYLDKMSRYTNVQAQELLKSDYQFRKQDLFEKPLSEFLSRYFSNQGYKDGLHGLSLSLLQAFSFFVLYLRIWEKTGFKKHDLDLTEFEKEKKVIGSDVDYWINHIKGGTLKKFIKIFKK